jgi:hypothetical protein
VQEAPDAYTAYTARVKTCWLLDVASREIMVDMIGNDPLRQLYYQLVDLLL